MFTTGDEPFYSTTARETHTETKLARVIRHAIFFAGVIRSQLFYWEKLCII